MGCSSHFVRISTSNIESTFTWNLLASVECNAMIITWLKQGSFELVSWCILVMLYQAKLVKPLLKPKLSDSTHSGIAHIDRQLRLTHSTICTSSQVHPVVRSIGLNRSVMIDLLRAGHVTLDSLLCYWSKSTHFATESFDGLMSVQFAFFFSFSAAFVTGLQACLHLRHSPEWG